MVVWIDVRTHGFAIIGIKAKARQPLDRKERIMSNRLIRFESSEAAIGEYVQPSRRDNFVLSCDISAK
jgi:hypothetical protein